jgi:hypothetical protein
MADTNSPDPQPRPYPPPPPPREDGADALAPQSPLAMKREAATDKYVGQLDELSEDQKKEFAAGEAETAPLRGKVLQMLQDPNVAKAHLEKVQDEPKPEDYRKNSLEFASAMAVMGALAGRFTRAGGTAALNAFSGALKGWNQGNQQAYEDAAKQWEAATKKTLDNNNIEIEKYKEIMADKKANIDQMMAAMNLVAAEHQNKIMFDATLEKNYTMAFGAVDKMYGAQEKLQGSYQKLLDIKNKQDEKNHTNAKWLASPEGQAYIATLPPGDQAKYNAFIQQYGGGQPRSAPAMALKKFIQENPEATSEQISQFAAHYSGEQKATRDFSSGTQGNAIRSFSVALDHLDVADQLGHALQTGNSQGINALRNAAKQQFGWDGPIDFNFAKKIVGDEITKSILGSGAGTGQDREDIQKAFNAANSPQQLEGVIRTAKRLMAGQLHGLKQQYEQTTKQTDFDDRLSPAARRELEGLGSPGAAAGGDDGWGEVKVH